MIKIGIVGTGFIARGLSFIIARHTQYVLSSVLTRRHNHPQTDYGLAIDPLKITNSIHAFIDNTDIIVECSGSVLHGTEVIYHALKAGRQVITMNAELQVTTGSWLQQFGYLTEAEGDQPGSTARLHQDVVASGFKPLILGNIKGYLNHNPTLADMIYWSKKNGISLNQVTSFTDGTKVQIEQALVANGLGVTIAQNGLLGCTSQTLQEGALELAYLADTLGYPISDFIIPNDSSTGVFIVATHDPEQQPYLQYYKLGEGPYYILERTFHLCHLEIMKTVTASYHGDPPLLNNGHYPHISVAAIAKKPLYPDQTLEHGIGSFDMRGEAIKISDCPSHIPIGLIENCVVKRPIEAGQTITFDDLIIPDSMALSAWQEIHTTDLSLSATQHN
jgi:predicted homoserine dehydrogenase-like protein